MTRRLIDRLVREQIDPSAAPVPKRLAVRAGGGQVAERRRVIPAAHSDLARIGPATIPADSELTGARLLGAPRPVKVRGFGHHEQPGALRVDDRASKDDIPRRLEREPAAGRGVRKDRWSLRAAL